MLLLISAPSPGRDGNVPAAGRPAGGGKGVRGGEVFFRAWVAAWCTYSTVCIIQVADTVASTPDTKPDKKLAICSLIKSSSFSDLLEK